MTPIPESTMREARAIAFAAAGQVNDNEDARCVETLVMQLVSTALHAARQDQIRKDAEIARQNGRDFSEALIARPASVCFGIAAAIETQGGEK